MIKNETPNSYFLKAEHYSLTSNECKFSCFTMYYF